MNGKLVSDLSFTAKNGVFNITNVKAKGTPGSAATVTFNFTLANNQGIKNPSIDYRFNLNFKPCPSGTLVNPDGRCESCQGNSSYYLGEFP